MSKSTYETFKRRLEVMPPIMVRLSAKHPTQRRATLSDEEISERSGLDLGTVKRLNWLLSWDTVTIGEMHAFFIGCNVNILDHRVFWNNLNSRIAGKQTHLTSHPEYLTQLKPLIAYFFKSQKGKM